MFKSDNDTQLIDGKAVVITHISSPSIQGMFLNIGAAVQSLLVKDKDGCWQDIVLGFDDLESYLYRNTPSLGVVHAVVTNRIKGGTFTLNGNKYLLAQNADGHALHIGKLSDKIWQVELVEGQNQVEICYSINIEDGYGGLPGPLTIKVTYILTEGALSVFYKVIAYNQPVVANLTNHSYFNLDGNIQQGLKNHRLSINSSKILAVDDSLIPTGGFESLDSCLRFERKQLLVNEESCQLHPLLLKASGYDFHYVFDKHASAKPCASLYSSKSGIEMTVRTDCPGLQLYTANFLSGITGKDATEYTPYSSVCLETQYPPDAIHHQGFESIVIPAHSERENYTSFHFSIH